MKFHLFILIAFAIGFSGCEKSNNTKTGIPAGTYYGTFQRITASGDAMVSNVSISFGEGKWNGQTDIEKYPALCHGSYEFKNDKVIFTNECAWTADFDWSLILSGEYSFSFNDSCLTITKSYNSTPNAIFQDRYILSLPKNGVKQSPVNGTWIESLHRTDTMVFLPEYDGQFPIFRLGRALQITDSISLPGNYSGPYWYIVGNKSISLNWFLSSSSIFKRYYFEMITGKNEFRILNFFSDEQGTANSDTLTFEKVE